MLTKIRKNRNEEGYSLIELLVVILILGVLSAIAIPAFLNQREQALEARENAKNCEQPKDITNDLVNYIEEYNVNNPSNKLENFEILNSGTYKSKTHPDQESDSKFSLIVSEVVCQPYKMETIKGEHFVIKKGSEEFNKSADITWNTTYDSRKN